MTRPSEDEAKKQIGDALKLISQARTRLTAYQFRQHVNANLDPLGGSGFVRHVGTLFAEKEPEVHAAEVARLREALRNLIDRYDEVVTTPDCSCSQDDHDVMMARRALELSSPE